MTPVVPCIVHNVTYVMKINHESDFSCQAQYLVIIKGDSCCSVQYEWTFHVLGLSNINVVIPLYWLPEVAPRNILDIIYLINIS